MTRLRWRNLAHSMGAKPRSVRSIARLVRRYHQTVTSVVESDNGYFLHAVTDQAQGLYHSLRRLHPRLGRLPRGGKP